MENEKYQVNQFRNHYLVCILFQNSCGAAFKIHMNIGASTGNGGLYHSSISPTNINLLQIFNQINPMMHQLAMFWCENSQFFLKKPQSFLNERIRRELENPFFKTTIICYNLVYLYVIRNDFFKLGFDNHVRVCQTLIVHSSSE